MPIVGLDPDDVDLAGRKLKGAAQRLEQAVAQIDGPLRSMYWSGAAADAFRASWGARWRSQLLDAAADLRRLSSIAASNVWDQERASGVMAQLGFWGLPTGLIAANVRYLRSRFYSPGQTAVRERSAWFESSKVEFPISAPAAAQLAWWKGFDANEQLALLENAPGSLVGLEGLEFHVREEAYHRFLDDLSGEIPTRSTTDAASLRVGADIAGKEIHIAAGAVAKLTTMEDQSTLVTLTLEGEIGIAVSQKSLLSEASAGLVAGGGYEHTYRFDSEEEALAFLDATNDALVPEPALLFVGGASAVAASVVSDVHGVLGRHEDNRVSRRVFGRLGAEAFAETPVSELGVGAQLVASHDLDTNRTEVGLDLAGHASTGVDLPALPGMELSAEFASQGSLTGRAVFEGDELIALRVSATGDYAAGLAFGPSSADGANHLISQSADVSRTVTAELDMASESNRQLVNDFFERKVPLSELGEHAYLTDVVDKSNTSSVSAGVDARLFEVEGTYTHTDSERVITRLRPPGGSWLSYDGVSGRPDGWYSAP